MLNPLIITLSLNAEAQQFFDDLRRQYFPAERNFLQAHLTLFHQLPAGNETVLNQLTEIAAKQAVFTMDVSAVVSTGRGAAYKIESTALANLHKQMQRTWAAHLIPQDRHTLWPHITVQNKVTNEEASALAKHLQAGFTPFGITATGFNLWAYLGGPWEFLQSYPFSPQAAV